MDTNQRRTSTRQRRLLVAAAAVVILAVLIGSPARANSPGRTHGDAAAAFNAEAGGGFIIGYMVNPHDTPGGAPAGGITTGDPEDVRIYPNFDGSYCASGWHVIFLSVWDGAQFYETHKDLFASLLSVDLQFAWDGVPLVVQETAIKRMLRPDEEETFMFNAGTLMQPGTLTVGEHTLTTSIIDPVYGDDTWSVKVTILPC